ncbi:MAG: hypothetical protein HYY17_00605 [Planctomycetes bacterium]|nr:hypothetical protein [Planctomycetota bacterium]
MKTLVIGAFLAATALTANAPATADEVAARRGVGLTFINQTTEHVLVFYVDGKRASDRVYPGGSERIRTTAGRHKLQVYSDGKLVKERSAEFKDGVEYTWKIWIEQ